MIVSMIDTLLLNNALFVINLIHNNPISFPWNNKYFIDRKNVLKNIVTHMRMIIDGNQCS